MELRHIVILGAGPTGLSAALSLAKLAREQGSFSSSSSSFSSATSQEPPPFHITVLEIRPVPSTIGGTINLTPLALRYLDRLGAGAKLRRRTIPVRHIDLVSMRTGGLLCSLWPNADAVRAKRADLMASLLETCAEPENRAFITIRFGVNVVGISEPDDEQVVLTFDSNETIRAEVLIGCDGIHSAARRLYVDPDRPTFFSGKVVAYGSVPWSPSEESGAADNPKLSPARLRRADGTGAVTDTTVFTGRYGFVLATFAQPARDRLFFAIAMCISGVGPEGLGRAGWRARHGDQEAVRRDILHRFQEHRVGGLLDVLGRVEDWTLFPVYQLRPAGRWRRGRVMLIGDAAHAASQDPMPPQGESTGVAVEDGVLLAHVFRRHRERSVPDMCADYEALRRNAIDKLYRETTWRWEHGAIPSGNWLWSIVVEWMTVVFVYWTNLWQVDHFASDVEKLLLPEE